MKTLKEKIVDEGKYFLGSLVPFAFANKKYGNFLKRMRRGNKEITKHEQFYGFLSGGITAIEMFGLIVFSFNSLRYSTPNFTKWPEIQKRDEQQTTYRQNQRMKDLFYKTAGKDSVIDYKEFEKFYKENYSVK